MASTHPSPGAVPDPSPVAAHSRRDRMLLGSCIVLVTALAWAYLFHLNRQMTSSASAASDMAAMGMVMDAPWGVRDVLAAFAMWSTMMIGMMTPAAAPVLVLFAGAEARRASPGRARHVPLFALGYLAIWLGFSAGAALAQWGLHAAALLAETMAATSSVLAGVILIAAGIYQLTPLKTGCLTRCQSPLGFLMSNWRDGPGGAFRMGARHGAYCLGCCWALMAVLFVVGVMNLVWVGVLTVFILVEKLGFAGARVARVGGGVTLIALGIRVLLR